MNKSIYYLNKVFWGFGFLLISFPLFGSHGPGPRKFLESMVKKHPDFQTIAAEQAALPYIVDQGLPSPRTVLSLRNEKGFNSNSEQNTTVLIGGLTKEIIQSGTELSLNHSKTTRPDREENVTQFRVEQALYKNLFGRDVRLQKESLSAQEHLRRLELLESYEFFLSQALVSYLQLNKRFNDFVLAQALEREAGRLFQNVQAKRRAGIASATDIKRSELLLLIRQEQTLTSRRNYEAFKKQLEISSELPDLSANQAATEEMDLLLKQLQEATKHPPTEKLRVKEIAALKLKVSEQTVILSERSGGPELNLIAGYNKDDSTRFATSIKRNETVVGLKLEIPLGDDQVQAQTAIARIDTLKAQAQLKANELTLATSADELAFRLKELKEKFHIQENKVRLVKGILQEEVKRYSIGKIDLERLIELENNSAQYQLELEQGKLELAQAIIEWLALNDRLDSIFIFN